MAQRSLTQRLVEALDARADELDARVRQGLAPSSLGDLATRYRGRARELAARRGSGRLPSWARALVDELGLEAPPRRTATGTT